MEHIKYLTKILEEKPELAEFIYELIQSSKGYETKRRLITLLKGSDYNKAVDTAIPLEWANRVRDMELSTGMIVWDYNEHRVFGGPFHIADEVMKKLSKIVNNG